MENGFIEASYPIGFRQDDAKRLGDHIRLRHNVELIGMLHVGISNFLRFFLFNKQIISTYINHGENHLLVPVDLNDLVERDLFPFWSLTFKRLVDRAEESKILNDSDKANVSSLFDSSIQSKDLFMTIENLRKSLTIITAADILPTLFFIRFDRIKDATSPAFFSNLEGLIAATGNKLSYVFTSFRPLHDISPEVFSRKSLSSFSHLMYVKTAESNDMKVIFETFEKKYNLTPTASLLSELMELVGGHVYYLQISLAILNQHLENGTVEAGDLYSIITSDERVNLLSEEIWESLNENEQRILLAIFKGGRKQKISELDKTDGVYLWETGLVKEKSNVFCIFSPLFEQFLKQKGIKRENGEVADLTKKENLLFNFLKENVGEVCEREKIIETVWGEYEGVDVSDWTIDRLVARLRAKLKSKNSEYSIVTVKTRGYKLVTGTNGKS